MSVLRHILCICSCYNMLPLMCLNSLIVTLPLLQHHGTRFPLTFSKLRHLSNNLNNVYRTSVRKLNVVPKPIADRHLSTAETSKGSQTDDSKRLKIESALDRTGNAKLCPVQYSRPMHGSMRSIYILYTERQMNDRRGVN